MVKSVVVPATIDVYCEGNLLKRLLKIDLKAADLKSPSVVALILGNLLPVYGVLFLKWEVFPILLLYWMENVIIWFYNILKMAVCSPSKWDVWAGKIFMIPFFTAHYGIFTLVHGIFVLTFFGGMAFTETEIPSFTSLRELFTGYDMFWGFLSMFLSHGISFALNYIGKGEFKRTNLTNLMMQPYERVIILHLTIIFAGTLVAASGSATFALILMVSLKIIIDLIAHLKLHFKPLVSQNN